MEQKNNNNQQTIGTLSINVIKLDKSKNSLYDISISKMENIDLDMASKLCDVLKDFIWKHNTQAKQAKSNS